MIRQTILPFKVDLTNDLITSHAGLSLFAEFAIGCGFSNLIDKHVPGPGSGAGFRASEHVFPLVLMLNGGGRSLEDLREIREDEGLREVLELRRMPSSDATGDWCRRAGANGGLEGLSKSNQGFLKRGLKKEKRKGYTLDIDATGIEAEKQSAKMTYKGFRGYMPMVGHLAENGLIVGDEFREGNDSPGARNYEFVKHCESQMPKGKRIVAFRSDSAAYQAKVINHCEERGMKFAIGGDLDTSVRKAIAAIGKEEWREYGNGWIAETVHSMEKTKKAFRLIVIRRPCQGVLFDNGDAAEAMRYTMIATNREESAEEVVRWYNQRGECSENRIKELKIGFAMERMPFGQFAANAVFFRIGVITYNFYKMFVSIALGKKWHHHQVQTIRWKLYNVAGKVVFGGRYVKLKVRRRMGALFEKIRLRAWQFVHV
jgi:hypothetical protein